MINFITDVFVDIWNWIFGLIIAARTYPAVAAVIVAVVILVAVGVNRLTRRKTP